MKNGWCVMVSWLVLSACATGDVEPPTEPTEPERLRGEVCDTRDQCADGLACVMGVCSRGDFDITVSAKHCDVVDCGEDADCCGSLPLEEEARCKNQRLICETPMLPGCYEPSWGDSNCDANDDCGSGKCRFTCSASGESCSSSRPCAVDECYAGRCTLSYGTCESSEQCTRANVCGRGKCHCTNPLYDPGDPICAEQCEDTCSLACRSERCVTVHDCEDDNDCLLRGNLDHCVEGQCVECTRDSDCSAVGSECRSGTCRVPCVGDSQCPLFQACTAGQCVETGCQSDRECVLALASDADEIESRLAQCLDAEDGSGLKRCRVPCELDAECTHEFEACVEGFCTFLGCESDAECRAFLGLEPSTEMSFWPPPRIYAARAVCRE